MEKLVTYSLTARKNPQDPESPAKYYARAQARGVMTTEEIATRIQRECTVTRPDVVAVLTALEEVVSDGLKSGEIIRLGSLGSLQVSLSGEGSATEEAFTTGLIKRKRILFRPGSVLQSALKTLAFERVDPLTQASGGSGASDDEEEEEGGEPDGGLSV